MVTQDEIIQALNGVIDPIRKQGIATLGMVTGLEVKEQGSGQHVSFAIQVDPQNSSEYEKLRLAAERIVAALPDVLSVTVVLTAHRASPRFGGHGRKMPSGEKINIPGVEHIVAVASGKGGVGKSTTATNIAVALAAKGMRTGILDADIYGPSLPRMFGITQKPEVASDKKLIPISQYGVSVMSMGFLVEEDKALIWRGPMIMGAIQQMLRDVAWGKLDVLVVDLPPGTGDAQLTLVQQTQLAGAVIVSTPQDIALIDARKALQMFRRVDVPVFGMIENMSFFSCPHCGQRSEIFGHGGARAEAEKLGCDFLGEIPIDLAIRMTSDAGKPITVTQPAGPQAQAYGAIAQKLMVKLALVSSKLSA